jgi:plasmid stabilization system protein ParE
MAPAKPKLTVLLSATATAELAKLWRWNAKHYDPDHADRYLDYLTKSIYGLEKSFRKGRVVRRRAELRYLLFRGRSSGHGHLAVYRCTETTIDVLHVFHTAQDCQRTLSEEG